LFPKPISEDCLVQINRYEMAGIIYFTNAPLKKARFQIVESGFGGG
jgi:hypothetical protein